MVRPTNCGKIVERRDQVLMISLRPEARDFSAFFSRWPSSHGPFQVERVTSGLPSLLPATPHDVAVGRLVLARLGALGALAPWRHRVAPAGGAAFAAAMRVVDRVHRHAAHRGLLAEPAVTAGLAD